MLKAASASLRAPENAQIGGAAQHPIHEEAVQDHIAAVRRCGIGSNHIVGDRSTETTMTRRFKSEVQQGSIDGMAE